MNAEALADFLENENIEYRQNEPMRAHTTFKIGGEADIFIIPASPAALIYAVKKCNELEIPYFILGNGSNLLVSDGKLPATRELSKLLGVSRNSVITAYENLEEEGILYTVKGKGTFVSEVKSINEGGWKVIWNDKVNNYGKLANELDIVKNEIEETYHTKGREKLPLSYDIWEMHEGVHLYSLASIYGAFNSMLEIYDNIKEQYTDNRLKLENIHKNEIKIKKYIEELKKYISKNLYDETTKTLLRNLNDKKTDISILGVVEPFGLFAPEEKKIKNTIEKINLTLRTYTGGYLRFEQDHYMEGQNPWPIATLWMAMYYDKIGKKEEASECIRFVVNSCNEHGLLAEQIDNKTMTPNWVIGLGWSHAMFILSLWGRSFL